MPNEDLRAERQDEREFEAVLTQALRRVEAPEGFAARVMARAEAEERTAQVSRAMIVERSPWWRVSLGWKPIWGAMAAILVAGVLTGHVVHDHRQEQRARAQASREFDVSVQITERALDHTREQLRKAGVPLDGEQ